MKARFFILFASVSCVINVFSGKVFAEIDGVETIFCEEIKGRMGDFGNNGLGLLVGNGGIKKGGSYAAFAVISVYTDEKKMGDVAGGRVGYAKAGYDIAFNGSIDGRAFAAAEVLDKGNGFFTFEEKFFFDLLIFGAVGKDFFYFGHSNTTFTKK